MCGLMSIENLLTREQIRLDGFVLRGLYEGPFSLEDAVRLLQSLSLQRLSHQSNEFAFGKLILVRQGADGFNIVEVLPPSHPDYELYSQPLTEVRTQV